MILLENTGLLERLESHARQLSDRILQRSCETGRIENAKYHTRRWLTPRRICSGYEKLAQKLLTAPVTVEEVEQAVTFIQETKNAEMKELECGIEVARNRSALIAINFHSHLRRLIFMISFAEMSKEEFDLNSQLFTWPQRILPVFEEAEALVKRSKAACEEEMVGRRKRMTAELDGLMKQVDEVKSFGDIHDIARYHKTSQRLQSRLDTLMEKQRSIERDEMLIGAPQAVSVGSAASTTADSSSLQQSELILSQLAPFSTLYSTITTFQLNQQQWLDSAVGNWNPEKIEESVTSMWRSMVQLSSTFDEHAPAFNLLQHIQSDIEKFRLHLPVITLLGNRGLRERHWVEISNTIGFQLMPPSSAATQSTPRATSLADILQIDLSAFMNSIELISARSSKEYSFELALGSKIFLLISRQNEGGVGGCAATSRPVPRFRNVDCWLCGESQPIARRSFGQNPVDARHSHSRDAG